MIIEATCADPRAADALRYAIFEVSTVPRVGDWLTYPDGHYRQVTVVTFYAFAIGTDISGGPVARVGVSYSP